MSEINKPETPKEQVVSGLVRRQDVPRFLRDRITQEDLKSLNYDHNLYGHVGDSQTPEMINQEIQEVERLTGKRVGPTAGEIRRMQESVARTHLGQRQQG